MVPSTRIRYTDIKTEIRHHLNVNEAFFAVHLSQEGRHEGGFSRTHSSHYCNQTSWLNVQIQTAKHTYLINTVQKECQLRA